MSHYYLSNINALRKPLAGRSKTGLKPCRLKQSG